MITRDKFDEISQYFHLNNNDNAILQGQPKPDKIFKVQPILEAVVMASVLQRVLSQTEFPHCRGDNWFQGMTFYEAVCFSEVSEKRTKILQMCRLFEQLCA